MNGKEGRVPGNAVSDNGKECPNGLETQFPMSGRGQGESLRAIGGDFPHHK